VWIKPISALALVAAFPVAVTAVGSDPHLDHVDIDITNKAAVQRGAKYFVNYCLGCHSARYIRYARLAQDTSLSPRQVEQNLLFTDQKIAETMTNAMQANDAEQWFGNAPPDLTLIARSRGVDWVYTYLRSFYLDDSRPFGVNNLVYPNVVMPHVLWPLQGWQVPVYEETERGKPDERLINHLKLIQPGLMTPGEYDRAVRDLVTFLAYTAEPAQPTRLRVGAWVMVFLAVLLVLTYLLKREYWKDVH
jgi:ubiquinol-cytochrome c reductase cytochrome c1 subunit